MKPLIIGDLIAKVPIIQGGMGVGVSLGNLAGAVAREDGVGIISTAQIGFYREDFASNPAASNRIAIGEQIRKAKEIASGHGLVGVNIMVALKDNADHVITAAREGADIIISGAGMPLNLPELVEGFSVKIAPIVSSLRCTRILFSRWAKNYHRLPDMVVIEGPKAGGHLGFSGDEVLQINNYDEEIEKIISFTREQAELHHMDIPVVVAGGIYDSNDIHHAFDLGASGVQMASRFVCTQECDASPAYKEAYLAARPEDLSIIKSPVGMPGRAIRNHFIQITENQPYPVRRCYGCLARCNPAKIPYCITDALIRAVKGDTDMGLVFAGANVGRIDKIVTVHELMEELKKGL